MSAGTHRADTSPAAEKAVPAASRWRLYRLALAATATAVLLATPLVDRHDSLSSGTDQHSLSSGTDQHSLWHQLAQGRALLADDIGATSAGWLLSVLLHLCWQAFGFVGLALLRGVLYAAFLAGVAHYLSRYGRVADAGWLAWIFGLFAVLGFQHAFDLGPQIAGAGILLLCLAVLEGRGRRVWALPVVALVWMNLEGQFPVLLLMASAYVLEILLARRQGIEDSSSQRLLAILALSMAMVFATPEGLGIVDLPAESDEASAAAPTWLQLATFQFSSDGFSPTTPRNLLLACGALALIAFSGRRLRASHVVLAIGAFWLAASAPLSPAAAILLLPLIVAQGTPWPTDWESPWTRRDGAAAVAVALVLLTPFVHLARHWPGASAGWPLDGKDWPQGAAAFLEQQGALPLSQLHPPADDGYWQWVRPLAATPGKRKGGEPADTFARASAFVDSDALARYLIRHAPDLIAAPRDARAFPTLIARHPRYRPIFYDDTVVLYADRDRHSALVADHELIEAAPAQDVDPRRARARALTGDVLRAQGDLEGAIRSYRRAAADAAKGSEASAIYRRLADALAAKGDAAGAFTAFETAVGRFNILAPATDLHRLGELAAAAGRPDLARKFLAFAVLKLAPGELELGRRIEESRARLPPEVRR